MNSRLFLPVVGVVALSGLSVALAPRLDAQAPNVLASQTDARAALKRAEADLKLAGKRAAELEKEAEDASLAAVKAANESAALAARIQQAEAGITAAEARLALIQDSQAALDLDLAERREPLMRLTGALQRLARRPLALSALKPGTLTETVYVRAMLATAVPEVERRTQGLRAELAESRRMAEAAQTALSDLKETEATLGTRRAELAAFAANQRSASRNAAVAARRETERAFALAEEARDLDGLVGELDRAGRLRQSLAALPGPILRPPRPGASQVMDEGARGKGSVAGAAPSDYRLPVAGGTVSGFGGSAADGLRSQGITLAPRAGAVVVSPGEGRIAFAGPYRGYGRIVIVEHDNGWTSLVTGLARSDVTVGQDVVGGTPLGVAPSRAPRITLELRHEGKPVNPLRFVG